MQPIMGKTMAILALAGSLALAAERLPEKALPLSSVLSSLEKSGIAPIVEANFDDGVWEVEGYRTNEAIEVHVDPLTGKVLHEQPDQITSRPAAQAKSATAIVKLLEEQGYAPVLEIEWEFDHWEADAIHAQGKRKLHLSAETGKIISDRQDD